MESMTSGNPMVDAIGRLDFSGNMTPQIWYKTITKKTGKAYQLAITLLSDIVYWYKPTIVRDEISGQVIGWRKKFKGDLLQKTYQQYADLYGESKRTVKAALDRLEELGAINKEFRDVECENGVTLYNLMYISINEDAIMKLTYPERKENHLTPEDSVTPPTKNCTTPLQKSVGDYTENCISSCEELQEDIQRNEGGSTEKSNSPIQENVLPHTETCETNTYITTKNTDIDLNNHIHQPERRMKNQHSQENQGNVIDEMDETSAYMALIRDNLDYEHYMTYASYGDKELFEEIYETVCDVVCVKRRTIRINGEDYPYKLVKARFLKLNSGHIEYVMECMKDTSTKITNIRSYLITALYNAPSTINHYYQQEVQHDMFGGGLQEKDSV